jgi:hypothetical protein
VDLVANFTETTRNIDFPTGRVTLVSKSFKERGLLLVRSDRDSTLTEVVRLGVMVLNPFFGC